MQVPCNFSAILSIQTGLEVFDNLFYLFYEVNLGCYVVLRDFCCCLFQEADGTLVEHEPRLFWTGRSKMYLFVLLPRIAPHHPQTLLPPIMLTKCLCTV